jgi:hypothetical protein
MAQKTCRDYSAPSASNMPIRRTINTGDANFEIKTGLITMVKATLFCGKDNEDVNAHLQQFLELHDTISSKR